MGMGTGVKGKGVCEIVELNLSEMQIDKDFLPLEWEEWMLFW